MAMTLRGARTKASGGRLVPGVNPAAERSSLGPRAAVRLAVLAAVAAALVLGAPIAEGQFGAGIEAAAKSKRKAKAAQEKADRALARARQRKMPSRSGTAASADAAAKAAALPAASATSDGKPLTRAQKKVAVLAAPPEVLQRIGRHVITGYYSANHIKPLLERGGIGGVFVTARNARRRGKAVLAAEIADLRKLAAAAGQETFFIATDQEGGSVSRLSPPLPYQVSLPRLLRGLKTADERQKAIESYGEKQAAGLASLGVNLNFAPVADLNHNVRSSADRFTKIRYRAIDDDPAIVTTVARTYCAALLKARVSCTLKHFPGLGRVAADTHVTSATLKTSAEDLAKSDWLPFRDVLADTPAFVMVGHPIVTALDAERPASTSAKVVQGLLRDTWKFEGVVVTDDLAMGAITRRLAGGMGVAAVDALNAGVDLVLIGSDGDEVYDVLYALILADEQGRLTKERLTASSKRLKVAFAVPGPAASAMTSNAGTSVNTDAGATSPNTQVAAPPAAYTSGAAETGRAAAGAAEAGAANTAPAAGATSAGMPAAGTPTANARPTTAM